MEAFYSYWGEVFNSVFTGFVIYSLLLALFRIRNRATFIFNEEVDFTVCIVLWLVAGLSFILWVLHLIAELEASGYEAYSLPNRAFGPYWFAFWILFITAYLLPMLLLAKPLRTSVAFRITLAIWIAFAQSAERILIYITSFHRDFIESSWAVAYTLTGNIFMDFFVRMIVFLLLLSRVHALRKKIRAAGLK